MKNTGQQKEVIDMIYEIVKMIPYGQVSTYGAIANAIGLKSGARYVGYLMKLSDIIPGIPAHRVVNSTGLLSGKHHFGTGNEMQQLLEREGVIVKNDKVQQFKRIFWDPMESL